MTKYSNEYSCTYINIWTCAAVWCPVTPKAYWNVLIYATFLGIIWPACDEPPHPFVLCAWDNIPICAGRIIVLPPRFHRKHTKSCLKPSLHIHQQAQAAARQDRAAACPVGVCFRSLVTRKSCLQKTFKQYTSTWISHTGRGFWSHLFTM